MRIQVALIISSITSHENLSTESFSTLTPQDAFLEHALVFTIVEEVMTVEKAYKGDVKVWEERETR